MKTNAVKYNILKDAIGVLKEKDKKLFENEVCPLCINLRHYARRGLECEECPIYILEGFTCYELADYKEAITKRDSYHHTLTRLISYGEDLVKRWENTYVK